MATINNSVFDKEKTILIKFFYKIIFSLYKTAKNMLDNSAKYISEGKRFDGLDF